MYLDTFLANTIYYLDLNTCTYMSASFVSLWFSTYILKDYHDYIESSFPVPLVHCSNLVLSSV